MALRNQTSLDANLQISPDANEPIPSTVEGADLDDVIVIPSVDGEADINEPIPLPVEDADVEANSDTNINSHIIDVHVEARARTSNLDRIWVDLIRKEIKSLLDIIDAAEHRIERDTNVVEGLMKLILQNMKDIAKWMEQTRNLVIRQRVEDFQLGTESYQTQLNLTKPRWDATGFEYNHDFTVIESPRSVSFRDKYVVQMIMWFNKIHKFSDGTLRQIDEALDYRVKEFNVNRMNPSLNTRFWTKKYVDRSKEFMFAIQKRLKTRRIFRNLESFVGGRVREGDYRLLQRTE
uniref:Uncharacterized protein n=1 Tax=Tanacetum cinerariifolium TaxID=118510 RepID=A0A6L2KHR3_TANCI|nr:hypothetical protein [Tanacetum cinerariifolium]